MQYLAGVLYESFLSLEGFVLEIHGTCLLQVVYASFSMLIIWMELRLAIYESALHKYCEL